MGHETQIDVDDVEWFAGHGPVELDGTCTHRCAHRSTAVIAWGPTLRAYELIECSDCGCRVWFSAHEGGHGAERPIDRWARLAPLAQAAFDRHQAEIRGGKI